MVNPKILLKVATVAGPAIFRVLKKYGPQLREIYQQNPDLFKVVSGKITTITSARKDEATSANLAKRVEILREQVTYLYASANTPAAAEQARKWRNELAGIQKSLPLLDAMATKNRKAEAKALNERIDQLSAAIIAANIEDEVEDAVIDGTLKPTQRDFDDDTAY